MKNPDGRQSRREFLENIGRAVGGTAMLKAMAAIGVASTLPGCGSSSASDSPPSNPAPAPSPPPVNVSPRPGDWPANVGVGRTVTILGGGIAGMTAALEMTRLGYDCTVLEATDRAGGRNRTLRSGDTHVETDSSQFCQFDLDPELYFNPGPARIPHHHEFLLAYCREFGIALEAFVNDNRAARMHSPNAFNGQPQMLRRVRADTRGHIAALLSTAINQNALDQELSGVDRASVLAMLREFGDLDAGNNYLGSERAGFPGQENTGSRNRGQRLSPLALADLVSEFFWEQRASFAEGFEQQATMMQPVGGMDRIGLAFEAAVQQALVYRAEVTEIRKTANGTRIVYRDGAGTVQALDSDYCLCTIPATVLRNIPNDFATAHQDAIASFAYTPAAKTAFQSRRFWEQDHNIYGGISWTTQDITQTWYPNNAFGSNDGILIGSYIFGGNAGTRFAALTPQQRINQVISEGSALHAGLAGEATRGISVAWSKVPFQLGAWGVSTPGVLLNPDDNIFFAGEHLSSLQGWQEGAILSAYHAIDGIVSRDAP